METDRSEIFANNAVTTGWGDDPEPVRPSGGAEHAARPRSLSNSSYSSRRRAEARKAAAEETAARLGSPRTGGRSGRSTPVRRSREDIAASVTRLHSWKVCRDGRRAEQHALQQRIREAAEVAPMANSVHRRSVSVDRRGQRGKAVRPLSRERHDSMVERLATWSPKPRPAEKAKSWELGNKDGRFRPPINNPRSQRLAETDGQPEDCPISPGGRQRRLLSPGRQRLSQTDMQSLVNRLAQPKTRRRRCCSAASSQPNSPSPSPSSGLGKPAERRPLNGRSATTQRNGPRRQSRAPRPKVPKVPKPDPAEWGVTLPHGDVLLAFYQAHDARYASADKVQRILQRYEVRSAALS